MTTLYLPSVRESLALAIASAARFTCRFLVLAAALLCYGAVPSTANVQTEYEAQLQEEATAGGGAHFDLRSKLRGAAKRRAGSSVFASTGHFACQCIASAGGATLRGPRLSLGLTVPLRC